MFDHDPELPAGLQDADLEMASLEAAAHRAANLRAQGICPHAWTRGIPADGWPDRAEIDADRARGDFSDRPTNYNEPPRGYLLCLDCGDHVPDPLEV